jgi:hypothetical protein
MTDTPMVAIDGIDALAYVTIRPGEGNHRVVTADAANGISKREAAMVLRRVADRWDPQPAKGAAE